MRYDSVAAPAFVFEADDFNLQTVAGFRTFDKYRACDGINACKIQAADILICRLG